MRLRLTRPAARQLDCVLTDIARHNPQGALRVQNRIQAVMHLLLQHPQAGHPALRGVALPLRHHLSPYGQRDRHSWRAAHVAATPSMIDRCARVSTSAQDLAAQLGRLKAAGYERIFHDKLSGLTKERPQLKRLLKAVALGDTVIIPAIDRLSP